MQKFSIDYIDFARVASRPKMELVGNARWWNAVRMLEDGFVIYNQYLLLSSHLKFRPRQIGKWKLHRSSWDYCPSRFRSNELFRDEYTIGDKLEACHDSMTVSSRWNYLQSRAYSSTEHLETKIENYFVRNLMSLYFSTFNYHWILFRSIYHCNLIIRL